MTKLGTLNLAILLPDHRSEIKNQFTLHYLYCPSYEYARKLVNNYNELVKILENEYSDIKFQSCLLIFCKQLDNSYDWIEWFSKDGLTFLEIMEKKNETEIAEQWEYYSSEGINLN